MSKTALITGASSGIGAAFAKILASEGYALILHGRRAEKLEALANSIGEASAVKPSIQIILGDLVKPAVIQELIKAGNSAEICLLINNAGFGKSGNFLESEQPTEMLTVHAEAVVKLCHELIPGMLERSEAESGVINVSSMAGEQSLPGSVMYTSTKSFLTRFTQSLALELWDSALTIQALLPGFTHTDFHDKMPEWEMEKRNKGIVRWHSSEYVASFSLKKFRNRPRAIAVMPGIFNRLMSALPHILPKWLYYRIAKSAATN